MKKHRSDPVRDALKALCEAPEPRPANAFWADFRARASLVRQQVADAAEVSARRFLAWRPALAAAAVLIVAGVVLVGRYSRDDLTVAARPTSGRPALSNVEEVELFSDYSSVMIVQDKKNGGTLIWVAAASPASPAGTEP